MRGSMSKKTDDDESIEIEDVNVIQETGKALLCVIDGKHHWIPKSQIHDDSFVFANGHTGTLKITEWIAKEKGIV